MSETGTGQSATAMPELRAVLGAGDQAARLNQIATALRPDVVEAATVAAYTRDDLEPERQIPLERRRPDRQAYWREVGARAAAAALARLICPQCDSARTALGAPAGAEFPDEYDPAAIYCDACGHHWNPEEGTSR